MEKTDGSIKSRWQNFLLSSRSPHFSTLITLMIIFTGGYASLYSEEIRKAIPFTYSSFDGDVNWKALFFWICTVMTGGCFFIRERELDLYEAELRSEMIQQIQTLPPSQFLDEFAVTYDQAEAMYELAISTENIEVVEKTIRGLLTCLCQLTKEFDSPKQTSQQMRYAANIMLFVDATEISAEKERELQKRLKFVDQEVQVKSLRGVLDVQIRLSTSSEAKESAVDSKLVSFALPVPKIINNLVDGKKKSRVLPGAPMAFSKSVTDLYMDAHQLFQWCEENGDFTAYVKNQTKEYFNSEEGSLVTSFLSLPLVKDRQSEPIGVINIHKNGPNLLVDTRRLLHFEPIIRPYRHMLTKLVMKLNALQDPVGKA